MSRIGNRPIPVPEKAQVTIDGRNITVKGPKGTLSREVHPLVSVELSDGYIVVKCQDDSKQSRALHGLTRALLNNMVTGVTEGFKRELIVTGVGYKVDEKGNQLVFHLGYSHPIEFSLPEGITAKVERQKEIKVILEGCDKELIGLTASKIRELRPPEPYKGKGVQYADETIIRKAGKAAAK